MASMAQWDPDDTVQRLALEAARIAHEGLGSTQFEQLRITFSQQIEQENTDPEEQLRATVRLLLQKTNRDSGPKNVVDTQIAGMCLSLSGHDPCRRVEPVATLRMGSHSPLTRKRVCRQIQ